MVHQGPGEKDEQKRSAFRHPRDSPGALGQGGMAKWLETLDHPESNHRQDELGSTGQWGRKNTRCIQEELVGFMKSQGSSQQHSPSKTPPLVVAVIIRDATYPERERDSLETS